MTIQVERSDALIEIKTVQRGRSPVVGFIKDPSGVAPPFLGKREDKERVYLGKVGTG